MHFVHFQAQHYSVVHSSNIDYAFPYEHMMAKICIIIPLIYLNTRVRVGIGMTSNIFGGGG